MSLDHYLSPLTRSYYVLFVFLSFCHCYHRWASSMGVSRPAISSQIFSMLNEKSITNLGAGPLENDMAEATWMGTPKPPIRYFLINGIFAEVQSRLVLSIISCSS